MLSDLETKRDGIKFDEHEEKGPNYRRSQMVEADGKIGCYDGMVRGGGRDLVVIEGAQ